MPENPVTDSDGATDRPVFAGPIESELRAKVAELGDLPGSRAVYAEIAYRLARELDGDTDDGGATALGGLSRELRAALDEIWKGVKVDRPGDDIVRSLAEPVG